jgi:NADH-quinone oxidoreductase subunit I
MQFQPKIFDLDISVCMGCGICVEVCSFDSIQMDQVFKLIPPDRFGGLLLHKEQLAKSNVYFNTIQPTKASEIDAQRAQDKLKAQAKAKAEAERAEQKRKADVKA